jgi:serine/threonine protein kinase
MADVYLAEDEQLGRKVAVKGAQRRGWLPPTVRRAVPHQAQAAASLNHTSIVAVTAVAPQTAGRHHHRHGVRRRRVAQARLRRGQGAPPDEAVQIPPLAVLSAWAPHERRMSTTSPPTMSCSRRTAAWWSPTRHRAHGRLRAHGPAP